MQVSENIFITVISFSGCLLYYFNCRIPKGKMILVVAMMVAALLVVSAVVTVVVVVIVVEVVIVAWLVMY